MKEKPIKFIRCWACDRLVSNSESHYTRVEHHHIFGKDIESTIPLCLLCHDLLDRFSLDDLEVVSEWMKVNNELEEMPRGRYPMLKLFILKTIKIMKELEVKQNAQITRE